MKKLDLFVASSILAIAGISCQNNVDEPVVIKEQEIIDSEVNIRLAVNNSEIEVPDTNFRYVAYIYKEQSTTPIDTIRSSSSSVSVKLPKGNYHLVAWADYLPKDVAKDMYFESQYANRRSLLDRNKYIADDSQKMVFCGVSDFEVDEDKEFVKIALEPQMGQYKLLATDTANYNVGRVQITYPEGIPATIYSDATANCEKWKGLTYNAKFKDNVITFDNIFVLSDEAEIVLDIEVYDDKDVKRSEVKGAKLKILKGKKKVYQGKLYTLSSGGMNIKTDFDNEIIITLH